MINKQIISSEEGGATGNVFSFVSLSVTSPPDVLVLSPEIGRIAAGRASGVKPLGHWDNSCCRLCGYCKPVNDGHTVSERWKRESPSNQPGATLNPEWLVQRIEVK